MPVTKNYEFPLYDPDDSPDLTPTGREAAAVIAIDEALKNEEDGRIAGDAGLNTALEKETAERKAADKVLTDNLAKEVADRESADTALGGRIDAETTARETADTALGGRIDIEVSALRAADTALGRRIDAEADARGAADTALGGRIDAEADARGAADTALGGRIDAEVSALCAADTALGRRIDNAEAEISANSADLTGIKSLTYGDDHVAFLENHNGEYDSPALQEIEEQIAAGKLNVAIYGVTTFQEVQAMLPNVICKKGPLYANVCYSSESQINFFTEPASPAIEVYTLIVSNLWRTSYAKVGWDYVSNKPFNTIGTGLNTASESLSLDPSYLPAVSAGSGVTVTPITDGNHTKYEISATGGGGSGGATVTVSTGAETSTSYTGLKVTSTTDGNSTNYDIALNAATEGTRGGVTIGSGLNVNPAGIVSVDTASLPVVSGGAGILIDSSVANNRTAYTVLVDYDDTTIGLNDEGKLTMLSTSTGGITGNSTWSELEA